MNTVTQGPRGTPGHPALRHSVAARLIVLLLMMLVLVTATPSTLLAAAPEVRIRYGVRDLANLNAFNFLTEGSDFHSSDWLTFMLAEWTAATPDDTIELRAAGPDGSVPYQSQHRAGGQGARKDWFFFPILGTPAEQAVGTWNGQVLVNGAASQTGVHFKVLPGDYQKALVQAQALAVRYPKSPDPIYMVGAIQASLGKSRDARQSLNNAIRLAPAYIWPHIALARVMKQGGEHIPAANEIALARRLNQTPHTSLTGYVGLLLDALSR